MSIKATYTRQDGKNVNGVAWYTRRDVAMLLGVTVDTVKRWNRQGKMPYVVRRMMQMDGKMRRMAAIPSPAINAFFEKHWRPLAMRGRPITMDDLLY